MKRAVIFLSICLIFILPLLTAQLNDALESKNIESDARACILDNVENKGCSSFGLEDQIFTLLSSGKCAPELLNNAKNSECFGLNDCTIKTTSQSVLALSQSSADTSKYVDWILSKEISVPDFEWLIQVDSPSATSCTLKDLDNRLYQVTISEDKKLSLDNTANCLNLDSTGYWLSINPSCSEQDFEVSCQDTFSTSLLFKKKDSSTIYVLDKSPETSSGGGTTIVEQIESSCFSEGTSCNYEGTLWSALVLKKLDNDVSSYLAYLIAFENDNEDLLPESFLYYLTGEEDYRSDLILKQKGNKYWDEAGNRFSDTAVALLPFSNENFEAKENAITWLEEVQGEDGCWNSGNIAETGFILHSLQPKTFFDGGVEPTEDCEDAGNFCVKDFECVEAGGEVLKPYTCSGFSVCCTQNKIEITCSELGGEICDSTQVCLGSEDYDASDISSGEICCIGTCQEKTFEELDTCTPAGGACRDFGCENGEQESLLYECQETSQSCCLAKTETSKWWIWLLIILIALTAIAIVFRNKLKDFYFRLKLKKPKFPPKGPPPYAGRKSMPPKHPSSRTIPVQRQPMFKPRPKPKEELDEVLKKLKEMSK